MKKKVLLFNPRSANSKPRIPNSILQVAASIEGIFDYVLVDGNMETEPFQQIKKYLATGEFGYFGATVMPGPQLRQAIPFSKLIREDFPDIGIIWGGYFPSNQPQVVLSSGFVDVIINGMGDMAFPSLLNNFYQKENWKNINNLIFLDESGAISSTTKDGIYDLDVLPPLPYFRLNSFYPIKRYLGKTWLGTKTIAYHSSFGCPFTCSFCAVVPIYNARWKAKTAQNVYEDIMFLKNNYGGNAIEFHDNNFFVSEKRVNEFSDLMMHENMVWWGEGRIDTIDKYSDASIEKMRKAGCKMIFFGAETGNDALLKKMDKGGNQSAAQIKAFAARMAKHDIIPEYSFVLGTPADTEEKVWAQLEEDIAFIRLIKEINPATEIIIYMYSPVPTEGSELYDAVLASGFRFPERLEDWISPAWENFDLRKNPLTPWLTPAMVDRIKDFETVLNGYFPTVSDIRISNFQRKVIKTLATPRYKSGVYKYPYELKGLQKFWMKYRQPEVEGF